MKALKLGLAIATCLTLPAARADVPSVQSPYDKAQVASVTDGILDDVSDKQTKTAGKRPEIRSAIENYMQFLLIDPSDTKEMKNVLSRLVSSSTQVLLCANEDWECLEKKPELIPSVDYRRDSADDLGTPVDVSGPLKIEAYFTRRWADKIRGNEPAKETVADVLGEKIKKNGKKGVYIAIYGIDDIEGSMAPVYNAITDRIQDGAEVLGVFDVAQDNGPDNFLRNYDAKIDGDRISVMPAGELDFSYVNPKSKAAWVWGRPEWMDKLIGMDPKAAKIDVDSMSSGKSLYAADVRWLMNETKAKNSTRISFQYKETSSLMSLINQGISSNADSKARIEYPMNAIMHNKFFVLDSGKSKSVWTGTANVARTCMGDESNSNMSIYIDSDEVASAYLSEFQEMYSYDDSNDRTAQAKNLITGRFHNAKRPVSKRYFRFADGNELRVHFAPTDDGEHRAIIPMLLSAKKGDRIRISMFGAGGIEVTRALQYAAAQGAKIQIMLDQTTGSQMNGWLKDKGGNVLQDNPYSSNAEPIEVRLSAWLNRGLNHHKTATLTRKEGSKYRPEVLIVGSQNWSASGNDQNDENMVTIRNVKDAVPLGAEFNTEFDENLWQLAKPLDQAKLEMNAAAAQDGEKD